MTARKTPRLPTHPSYEDDDPTVVTSTQRVLYNNTKTTSVGISRNDINLEVSHMLKHCSKKKLEQQQVISSPTCGRDGILHEICGNPVSILSSLLLLTRPDSLGRSC